MRMKQIGAAAAAVLRGAASAVIAREALAPTAKWSRTVFSAILWAGLMVMAQQVVEQEPPCPT